MKKAWQIERELRDGAVPMDRRTHVDGFAFGVGLVFGRAGFDAQTAAGAVLRGNLNGELVAGEFLEFGIDRFEGFRSILQIARNVNFFANNRVRADRGAFGALDTQVGFPHRDFEGNVAFFPFGRAGRISTIHREGADGQGFAFEGDHDPQWEHFSAADSANLRARGAD